MGFGTYRNESLSLLVADMRCGQYLVLLTVVVLSACGGGGGDIPAPAEPVEPIVIQPIVEGPIVEIEPLPATRGLIPDIAFADNTFKSTHYSGNGECAACHNDAATGDDASIVVLEEAGPRDLSINRAWQTSLMANSARDPYWHAVVASELAKYPTLTEEINDTCTRCHAPMANDYAKKEGLPIQIFDVNPTEDELAQGVVAVEGFYGKNDEDAMFNHAMDGVSCSLCHQISDDGNLGTDEGMSGRWVVNEFPEDNIADRPAYGQYADPDGAYMREQAEFTATFSAHISESGTCGSCHNLQTNPVDDNGDAVEGVSHFTEQAVYTEWENSIFDDEGSNPTSCQSCHMPKIDQLIPIALGSSNAPRENFAEHTFLGANTVVQDMLKNFKNELGVDPAITEADFDESIERNREFLKSSAIVELTNPVLDDDNFTVDVEITNLTGHKLPSGYHTRRVYLHMLVTDATGQVVYENGRIQADGSIDGVSEDANPNSYEIHYDRITSPTQVQVYQAITGDESGAQVHSLLAATKFLKDNRLTPAGFNKADVPDDIAVQGEAADDGDFDNGKDTVTYVVPNSGTAPYNVLVELRYQPLSYGALQDLFSESEKIDQVDMFRTIYDSTSLRDEVINTSVLTLQ